MSDDEIIASFMEQKPSGGHATSTDSPECWWRAVHGFEGKHLKFECWHPRRLTLGALHEVEAKLTDQQWRDYAALLLGESLGEVDRIPPQHYYSDCRLPQMKMLAHADAPAKIAALAAVVRTVVEAKTK